MEHGHSCTLGNSIVPHQLRSAFLILGLLKCAEQLVSAQTTSAETWSISASLDMHKGIGNTLAVRSHALTELRRFDGGMMGFGIQLDRRLSENSPQVNAGIQIGAKGVEVEGWDLVGFALGQISVRLHDGKAFNRWYLGYGWSFGELHHDVAMLGSWVFRTGIAVLEAERWRILVDYFALRTSSYVDRIGVNGQVLYRTEVSPRLSAIGISLAFKLSGR